MRYGAVTNMEDEYEETGLEIFDIYYAFHSIPTPDNDSWYLTSSRYEEKLLSVRCSVEEGVYGGIYEMDDNFVKINL